MCLAVRQKENWHDMKWTAIMKLQLDFSIVSIKTGREGRETASGKSVSLNLLRLIAFTLRFFKY